MILPGAANQPGEVVNVSIRSMPAPGVNPGKLESRAVVPPELNALVHQTAQRQGGGGGPPPAAANAAGAPSPSAKRSGENVVKDLLRTTSAPGGGQPPGGGGLTTLDVKKEMKSKKAPVSDGRCGYLWGLSGPKACSFASSCLIRIDSGGSAGAWKSRYLLKWRRC